LAGFANFKSDAQGMEANTFLLEWTSESHTPIKEFELNWRKEDGDWEIFTVPAHRDNSIIWNGKWSFPDLEPATRYEARVLAKNTEGWSRPSPPYHFATFGAGEFFCLFFQFCDIFLKTFTEKGKRHLLELSWPI
jgi:hypothetical protein